MERIRWGIHSLCQHTLEAFLRLSSGSPQPTWRRGRNKRGLPAFIRTGPPEPTHLGPARPPPAVTRDEGQAPYRSLPEGCPWRPTDWCDKALDTTVVGARGPYSLAFQGTGTAAQSDILIASLNINGLTAAKLTELVWLIHRLAIDVLILVDVRCSGRQLKFLAATARAGLGPGSWTHASPSRSLTHHDGAKKSELVGGQLPHDGGGLSARRTLTPPASASSPRSFWAYPAVTSKS